MELELLLATRQLMRLSGQLKIYRNGKKVEVKNAREALEADQETISAEGREALAAAGQAGSAVPTGSVNDKIRLRDLIAQLKTPKAGAEGQKTAQPVLTVERESMTLEMEFVSSGAPLKGLVRLNRNQAETDRYQFTFKDGGTFTLRDKWTNRSTTIWGDPHVDLSDVEGQANGEFSDLTKSNTQTTLMLLDGTRVTFTAQDNGVIEGVDIFKDGQGLHGVGAAAKTWGQEATDLFGQAVTKASPSAVPVGDVVYAAGDGNDWNDAAGRRVWGLTTGPGATSRPAMYQQVRYQYTQEKVVVSR